MQIAVGVWVDDVRFEMVAARLDPPQPLGRTGGQLNPGVVALGRIVDPAILARALRDAAAELGVEAPATIAVEHAAPDGPDGSFAEDAAALRDAGFAVAVVEPAERARRRAAHLDLADTAEARAALGAALSDPAPPLEPGEARGGWSVAYEGPADRLEPPAERPPWLLPLIIVLLASLCVVIGFAILALG